MYHNQSNKNFEFPALADLIFRDSSWNRVFQLDSPKILLKILCLQGESLFVDTLQENSLVFGWILFRTRQGKIVVFSFLFSRVDLAL
jgi:hypothetical protein